MLGFFRRAILAEAQVLACWRELACSTSLPSSYKKVIPCISRIDEKGTVTSQFEQKQA
jgi:hypothetical protein